MRAVKVSHTDSDYLARGVHKGADGGVVLHHKGADFKSCGITVGIAIENDTDGSAGLTTAITEDTVTCTLAGGTNNTWTKDDQYSIYKTSSKDSSISFIYTDRRFGQKVVKGDILTKKGFFPEDRDIDEDIDEIFGEGQPEFAHD